MMVVDRMSGVVEEVEKLSQPIRVAILVVVHLGLFTAAYLGAFALRFDFQIPAGIRASMWQSLVLLLGVKTALFGLFGLFRGWWKYVSIYDVIVLAEALAIAALVALGAHALVMRPEEFPRSIYLLDFALSLVVVAGARGGLRLLRETLAAYDGPGRASNLLIVGAGDLGDLLVREITRADRLSYRPVAFLDDDARKRGLRLHGIPVEGPLSKLPAVVEKRDIEEIIVALEPDRSDQVRRIVDLAGDCDLKPQILPTVETVLDGELSLQNVRDLSITDLLGREPVDLDLEAVGRFLEDRVVMVTGAGGSIGSELCRQIVRFSPRKLVMVDCAETPLFSTRRQLADRHEHRIAARIGDVSDRERVESIFREQSPDIVLHAAAYKHVPLMEANPSEAVKNNVRGTRVVADVAAEHSVETFVLISTDKAVNPTSVMGATKRITELYVRRLAERCEESRFCTVRFGNVLGSNGSVVPIFREQIENGGPVTVTHPRMTRYFMTIPEAVQLVLQAASFDTDDDLFILDMGSPVRIADLARDMIRLAGMTEDQIPIVYTGIRPGEKLYEELTLDQEAVDTTSHEKISVGRRTAEPSTDFDTHFSALLRAADAGDAHRVRHLLGAMIPEYGPSDDGDSIIDFGAARVAR